MKSAAGAFIQSVHDGADDKLPQWARVYRAVRRAIDAGALAAGERLPSARQLARDWRVSRGAVDEAFAQLQLEELLDRRAGDGTYVAADGGSAARAREAPRREPRVVAREVLQHLRAISVPQARVEGAVTTMRALPLHPRAMPLDSFPLAAWRRLMVQAHDERQRALLHGGPPGGLPALREAIARHLALARGVSCSADQVLVLSTPREGITAVMGQWLRPGDVAAAEDPSHPSLPQLFSSLGARVVGVPLDEHGFSVEALQRDADDARVVYLHPLAQYPLGVSTTVERGDALLAWAERRQAWVIEGHYNDEWLPREEQPPTLFSRDRAGRVLLVGTFEGVMFPSLRVGYLVLPAAHAARFIDHCARLGERVPLTTQWAVSQFIDSGLLSAHLRQTQAELRTRRAQVVALLAQQLPAAVRAGPLKTGAQICLHLPAPMQDTELAERLRALRVRVEPLSTMCWRPHGGNAVVLGYMGWDEAAVLSNLRTVCQVLREAAGSAGSGPDAATAAAIHQAAGEKA